MYKNKDHIEKGVIEKIVHDDYSNETKYDIKFRDDRKILAYEDNILASDESDVSILPNDVKDFLKNAKCLTAEEISMIRSPPVLNELQKEWKILHDQYDHLLFAMMDKLVTNNILPNKFKVLKGKQIICPSCMFGKMRCRAWRTKGTSGLKTIRKESENFAGARVSIDQLAVVQPGLVPSISGKHTNTRICGTNGFFDNHTGYSFSSLQTSLDGEQTLAAKHAFESHSTTCGVEIC